MALRPYALICINAMRAVRNRDHFVNVESTTLRASILAAIGPCALVPLDLPRDVFAIEPRLRIHIESGVLDGDDGAILRQTGMDVMRDQERDRLRLRIGDAFALPIVAQLRGGVVRRRRGDRRARTSPRSRAGSAASWPW